MPALFGTEPAENVAINITAGTTNIKIRRFMVPSLAYLLEGKVLRRGSIRQTQVHVQR